MKHPVSLQLDETMLESLGVGAGRKLRPVNMAFGTNLAAAAPRAPKNSWSNLPEIA
ncbi:hypothetical protein [Aurantimonas coralicida]|uniref:hypothetical protein n=1 Tax=Aurantimonas coralicida TaxID=182270 RepID=UPI001D18A039|nr:hypothetical protein [Aurantimonas coralicida]MCC4299086.1 hypothetical protein [Aurantimonas coralicida]